MVTVPSPAATASPPFGKIFISPLAKSNCRCELDNSVT
jgi:hypothetical protein